MRKAFLAILLASVVFGSVQPQVNTVGLVLHYKMWYNKLSSFRIFDYALKNANGQSAGGIIAKYPGFDFSSGVINAQSGSSIDNIFDAGGTIAVWLRPQSQGPTNDGRVLDKTVNGSTRGWRIFNPGSDTKLEYHLVTDTTDGQWTFPLDITGDIWQHVALVYDSDTAATGGGPAVYVDGVAVVVTEVAAPDDARTSDAASSLIIGSETSGGNYYDGRMSDLMLFDIPLNGDRVRSIFESTKWRYENQ